VVRAAIEYFKRGDLFEAVPGQLLREACQDVPSAIFPHLKAANPVR
jgi:anthranilate synthase